MKLSAAKPMIRTKALQESLSGETGPLAQTKCPRLFDFEKEFPRVPIGKLYETALRPTSNGAAVMRIQIWRVER